MKKAFVLTMVMVAAALAFAGCKDDGKKSGENTSVSSSGEQAVKPKKLSKKNGITGNTFVNTKAGKGFVAFEKLIFGEDGLCKFGEEDDEPIYYQIDEKNKKIDFYWTKNADGTFSEKDDNSFTYEDDGASGIKLKLISPTGLEKYNDEFVKE